jgi:hypothetical protein
VGQTGQQRFKIYFTAGVMYKLLHVVITGKRILYVQEHWSGKMVVIKFHGPKINELPNFSLLFLKIAKPTEQHSAFKILHESFHNSVPQ